MPQRSKAWFRCNASAIGLGVRFWAHRAAERRHASTETMLAWAKQAYACIIFNIHVMPDAAGIVRAMHDFRRLIDRGLSYGGSYYLTYHRWAERRQVAAAYPQFTEFLRLKKRLDPAEVFQSEWYRHYRSMFADQLS